MAKATLQQIQDLIASEIDGNASISSGSSDWGNRLAPINRSLTDWAQTYDWDALKKIHNGVVSTATGNASYALPANFEKLDGYPKITYDGSDTYDFPAIDPSDRYQFNESDKYVMVLGNPSDGYTMYINASTLSSGASVQFTYYTSPVSLVSAGSLCECPDPTYLVQRSLYYIYKSREDGRFPEAKVEADKILARMVESENSKGISHADRYVHNFLDSTYKHRIGRD